LVLGLGLNSELKILDACIFACRIQRSFVKLYT
jgi:hypothetical protein